MVVKIMFGIFVLYNIVGIGISKMREDRLAPLCSAHGGWEVIDTGIGQSAKCLDPITGLMYLPPEVFKARKMP